MNCFFSLLTAFFLWLPFHNFADQREELLAKHAIKEFKLKNGMRICLKRTDYAEDEFVLQLFAMGGFAALPPNNRPTAILAPTVAWESGLSKQSADQIACDLYQHSIEMEIKVQAFDRLIEASGPTEELEYCLELIQSLLTTPHFQQDALNKVLDKTRCSLQSQTKSLASENSARNIFLQFNTQNWDVWAPLNLTNLNDVNLKMVQQLFQELFANPSEFVLVLVGDINFQKILPLLKQYLEFTPSTSPSQLINPSAPTFPEGITKKEIYGFSRYTNTLTRLTFPISIKQVETLSLELLCDILFKRLNNLIDSTKQLDISYEFPLFPCLDNAWLTIEFSSSRDEIPLISQKILTALDKFKNEELNSEEISFSLKNLQKQKCEIIENDYILSLLSNYYRAGWDLTKLYEEQDEKEMVKKNKLNHYLNLDQYSIISLHP
jgi:zinc protease